MIAVLKGVYKVALFSRGFNSHVPTSRFDKNGSKKRSEEKSAPITLDPQQKAIVESTANNILVIAGAGSGKTRVLTERIKYLVNERGVLPHNIVAITFTNMAADEMRDRLFDVKGIGDAFIGTIHSFANHIMKRSGEEYKIYSDEIDNEFHHRLITRYCKHITFDKYLKFKDLMNDAEVGKIDEREALSYLSPSERAELKILDRSEEEIKAEIKETGSTKYPESIKTLCKKYKVITFDELLVRADRYFRSIGAKVEHLLVDEFQDVGTLEFRFIEGLNADNYFIVGDDWQSIYGFKGGNVSLFIRLAEDSSFVPYYLTNNYRNCKEVLNIADVVINQVSKKVKKSITPIRDTQGEVTINTKSCLPQYLSQIKDSHNFKDWFILTRTNKDLFQIVEYCREAGIPCVSFKREGMSLYDLRSAMSSNKVKVLTVHTAKGLESKNVILYGKFPLICPSYMNDEEERKVMYVGVTRAEDRLIILN